MHRLQRYLLSKIHPKKHVRRIMRGGFDNVDTCRVALEQVAHHLSGVMTTPATIDYICEHGISIARIGDGEFECLAGNSIPFQKRSKHLRTRLLEILRSDSEHCLIAFQNYECPDFSRIKYLQDLHYVDGCFAQVSNYLIESTSPDRVYGNAFMSRVPAFKEVGVDKVKQLWAGRDVVLVTGNGGVFSLDQRLFDNWKSVSRVYSLSRNAFSEYDDLLRRCLRFDNKNLFLISLGPTATVLAYDLSHAGYQALDIGHLPNCFHEYLGEAQSPERESKRKK